MKDINFYQVFSLFKLAIILEGSYSRHLSGQADDPIFATYDERVPGIADVAWSLCRRLRKRRGASRDASIAK